MSQDEIWKDKEGDCWFERNKNQINIITRFDWCCHILQLLDGDSISKIESVIEIGCSNGWRLEKLKKILPKAELYGCDISQKAVTDGQSLYPGINLSVASINQLPYSKTFDLIILSGILHCLDRNTILKSISEVDRITSQNGILAIIDFLPDFPQKRKSRHRPQGDLYIYKQNYPAIFESTNLYKIISTVTFDADKISEGFIEACQNNSRCSCTLLQKSTINYYPEII